MSNRETFCESSPHHSLKKTLWHFNLNDTIFLTNDHFFIFETMASFIKNTLTECILFDHQSI